MKHSFPHKARLFRAAAFAFCFLLALSQEVWGQEPSSLQGAPSAPSIYGIWENSSRFVEISPEGRMRVVLKPYYAFVYEAEGWMPCAVAQEGAFGNTSIYSLSLSYPGQRARQELSAAVIGEGLYTVFYVKEEEALKPAAEGGGEDALIDALSGFWICQGDEGAMALYATPPLDEFYCLYFEGSRYYRIRYWLTDARPAPLRASFQSAQSGEQLSVPKFLRRGGLLYTCVTGTGTTLRNYEQGTWERSEGAISFFADQIAFAGGQMSETFSLALSDDGNVMLLGEPQLARSKVSDMDAEIAEHNSRRRPQRKPPVDFMDLDFHWDEVERLRR